VLLVGRTAACELMSSSLRVHASILLLALKGGKRMGRRERGAGLVLWGNGAVQVCTVPALVLTATSISSYIYAFLSTFESESKRDGFSSSLQF
jgi:hypothetical protein